MQNKYGFTVLSCGVKSKVLFTWKIDNAECCSKAKKIAKPLRIL